MTFVFVQTSVGMHAHTVGVLGWWGAHLDLGIIEGDVVLVVQNPPGGREKTQDAQVAVFVQELLGGLVVAGVPSARSVPSETHLVVLLQHCVPGAFPEEGGGGW